MHMIYRNVHPIVLFVLYHWVMLIRVHIDAVIIVARVLYDVNCCLFTELGDLSFSLHFACASFEHELYMCFELHHAIFTVVLVLYF